MVQRNQNKALHSTCVHIKDDFSFNNCEFMSFNDLYDSFSKNNDINN